MTLLFWISLALIAYAYVGYAVLLSILARLSPHHLLCRPIQPSVSILIAAHNEEQRLPAKLANLAALDYPRHLLQTVIASDGSTDGTNQLLAHPGITPVLLPQALGKANALNHAAAQATGDILVFLDVRQTVDPDALHRLVACFADHKVGAVSGELLLESPTGQPTDALGIYWKIEKLVRKLESRTGSVIGATGAIYAIRRSLYTPMPPGTILDDVFIPMHVARHGYRVIFQPAAIARDRLFAEPGKEFGRKVRTLTGNYQLLQLAPWLLTPANPLLFRLISHKLLRLIVPLLLVFVLISSATLGGPFYTTVLLIQLVSYGLAGLAALRPATRAIKPVAIAFTFVQLNLAATQAFVNFVTGRQQVWR